MRAIDLWAQQASRFLHALVAVLFIFIALSVVVLVVLRYVFNEGLVGGNETIRVMFIYASVIGAAIVVEKREHIAINIGIDYLSVRMRRNADILVLLFTALINAVMFWYSLSWIDKTGDYLMPALQLPQIIKQICVPIGCGTAVLFCLARALCILLPQKMQQ